MKAVIGKIVTVTDKFWLTNIFNEYLIRLGRTIYKYHDREYAYQKWYNAHHLKANQYRTIFAEINQFAYKPLVSIIVPTYNTPQNFLHEMIQSVQAQAYENWELLLVDDASTNNQVRQIIMEYAEHDRRIKCEFLKTNHHIANATNKGIELAKGEFIALFDHDDLLWDMALYQVVKALNVNPSLNFIYSDEDKIYNSRDIHMDLFIKPDWNPEFLRSCNYITHLSVIRKSILEIIGYENTDYNGAQDWELILRVTRNIEPETIHHINYPIYSWRVHSGSTAKEQGVKPYVAVAQQRTLEDDLKARNLQGQVMPKPKSAGIWEIHYAIDTTVRIIVLSNDERYAHQLMKQCKWSNYLVYSSSQDVADDINCGKLSGRDLVLKVTDNCRVRNKKWLQLMMGYASRSDIQAVQPLIISRNIFKQTIQWSGTDYLNGLNWHSPRNLTQMLYLSSTRNVEIIDPIFYLVKAELFNQNHTYNNFRNVRNVYLSSIIVSKLN